MDNACPLFMQKAYLIGSFVIFWCSVICTSVENVCSFLIRCPFLRIGMSVRFRSDVCSFSGVGKDGVKSKKKPDLVSQQNQA